MSDTPQDDLTPVEWFEGAWCAKREDLACWERPDWPSGSKVRQFARMIVEQAAHLPLVVGCSAFSLMQVYVAAAAEKFARRAVVYVPARAEYTDATRYAIEHGAEVHDVRPCPGPAVYKARARAHAETLGGCVRWDALAAVRDTARQARNIPKRCKRVLVPTGSGLTAAGILAGLAGRRGDVEVIALAGSTMADSSAIKSAALKVAGEGAELPRLRVQRLPVAYSSYVVAALPDRTPLDPFYSAKAQRYVRKLDCLWLVGLRPVSSMPADCRAAFSAWSEQRAALAGPAQGAPGQAQALGDVATQPEAQRVQPGAS